MAESKGTKEVAWANWSANVVGKSESGRGQFNADRLEDYLQTADQSRHEFGLNHVAGVIKGQLKKAGRLPKDTTVRLGDEQIRVWKDTAVGPRTRPRGKSPVKAKEPTKSKKGNPNIHPDQGSLFPDI